VCAVPSGAVKSTVVNASGARASPGAFEVGQHVEPGGDDLGEDLWGVAAAVEDHRTRPVRADDRVSCRREQEPKARGEQGHQPKPLDPSFFIGPAQADTE
jgi:hypothetical protein